MKKTEQENFLFENVTEYDIDRSKRYDINLCGTKCVKLCGCDDEKLRVRLASNELSSIQSDIKVNIDDNRDHIDIDTLRKNDLSESDAKDTVWTTVYIPKKYIYNIELSVVAESIELINIECEQIELDVKTSNLLIDNIIGNVEVNCNMDMVINYLSLKGSIEINQISATSNIIVPPDCSFRTVIEGFQNTIIYTKNDKQCEDLSDNSAENTIELNGMKSELIIAVKG